MPSQRVTTLILALCLYVTLSESASSQQIFRIARSTLKCPAPRLGSWQCEGAFRKTFRCRHSYQCQIFFSSDHKCCFDGCQTSCVTGVDPVTRDGECPADTFDPASTAAGCRRSHSGCWYDSECSDGEKCCRTEACRFRECKAIKAREVFAAPVTTTTTTTTSTSPVTPGLTCPRSQLFFCPSDLRGVRPCEHDSDCQGEDNLCCHMECGKRCEKGVDTTPKDGTCGNITVTNCLMDYSGCAYDSECPDDQKCCKVQPCGYGQCSSTSQLEQIVTTKTTMSRTAEENTPLAPSPAVSLVCPSQRLFFCPPGLRGVRPCEQDSDCQEADNLCCHMECGKRCEKGVDTTPKGGSCPLVTESCLQDFAGCSHDSECPGEEKCCGVEGCGYKRCSAVQQQNFNVSMNLRRLPSPPSTPELKCPSSQLFFCPSSLRGVRPCEQDSDCRGADNLCCHLECGKRCEKGVDTTPRGGACPVKESRECIADFAGCDADSKCPGAQKCCLVKNCGYKECTEV